MIIETAETLIETSIDRHTNGDDNGAFQAFFNAWAIWMRKGIPDSEWDELEERLVTHLGEDVLNDYTSRALKNLDAFVASRGARKPHGHA